MNTYDFLIIRKLNTKYIKTTNAVFPLRGQASASAIDEVAVGKRGDRGVRSGLDSAAERRNPFHFPLSGSRSAKLKGLPTGHADLG